MYPKYPYSKIGETTTEQVLPCQADRGKTGCTNRTQHAVCLLQPVVGQVHGRVRPDGRAVHSANDGQAPEAAQRVSRGNYQGHHAEATQVQQGVARLAAATAFVGEVRHEGLHFLNI